MILSKIEIDKLSPDCWLKNNSEWYYPSKKIDLHIWDNVEILSTGYKHDLIYAWHDNNKDKGRLYRTTNI